MIWCSGWRAWNCRIWLGAVCFVQVCSIKIVSISQPRRYLLSIREAGIGAWSMPWIWSSSWMVCALSLRRYGCTLVRIPWLSIESLAVMIDRKYTQLQSCYRQRIYLEENAIKCHQLGLSLAQLKEPEHSRRCSRIPLNSTLGFLNGTQSMHLSRSSRNISQKSKKESELCARHGPLPNHICLLFWPVSSVWTPSACAEAITVLTTMRYSFSKYILQLLKY